MRKEIFSPISLNVISDSKAFLLPAWSREIDLDTKTVFVRERMHAFERVVIWFPRISTISRDSRGTCSFENGVNSASKCNFTNK